MKYDLLISTARWSIPAPGCAGMHGCRDHWRQDRRGRARHCRADGRAPHDQRRGLLVTPGLDRHARPCLRQRARTWAGTPTISAAERRHDVVRRRQHRLGDLCRAAPRARQRGADPRPRLCQSVGDRHRRHLARRRAGAFALCRSRGLRPHDRREPRPRDRRQIALRAGPRLGIHDRAGQDGAPHGRRWPGCR